MPSTGFWPRWRRKALSWLWIARRGWPFPTTAAGLPRPCLICWTMRWSTHLLAAASMCPFRIGKCTGKLMWPTQAGASRSRNRPPFSNGSTGKKRCMRWMASALACIWPARSSPCRAATFWWLPRLGKVPSFRCSFHEDNQAAACAGCRFFQKNIAG